MHFEKNEVISIASQRSLRAVIGSSIVILSVWHFDISLDNFTVFGLTFQNGAIDQMLLSFHVLFLVSYGFSWVGDAVSIGEWHAGELAGSGAWGGSTKIHSRMNRIVSGLESQIESAESSSQSNDDKATDIKILEATLDDLKSSSEKQNRFRWYFYFYFYGWYLVFPLMIGISAIFVELRC